MCGYGGPALLKRTPVGNELGIDKPFLEFEWTKLINLSDLFAMAVILATWAFQLSLLEISTSKYLALMTAPVHTINTALEEVTLITWHLEWLNSMWAMTWDFQKCGICDQQRLRSACAFVQTDQSICLLLEYFITVKLLTEHHLKFLCWTRGCTGSSESTLVKMPHCWKSDVAAHIPSSLRCLQSVKVPL